MITLVTYDITSPKRLRRMHRFMKELGLNTQKSVFECDIDDTAVKRIRGFCASELDLSEDSVRIYRICAGCMKKVLISGMGIKMAHWDYAIV